MRDKTYYYLAYREDGKVINKYIGDQKQEAEELAKLVRERKAYETRLKELQKDWKIYNKVGIRESSDELRRVIEESARGNDDTMEKANQLIDSAFKAEDILPKTRYIIENTGREGSRKE